LSSRSKIRKEIASKIKLFGKWSFENITVNDPGLKDYISLTPVYFPHSEGRHEKQRFLKSKVNIVERLVNQLMRPGQNCGKKHLAIRIVRNAFEYIHQMTGENPIQVLVRAIENAAPREEVTRVMYGGIVYPIAVDVSPQRRVDLALRHIATGARQRAFRSVRSIDVCLAEEMMLAANNDPKSYAISKKLEIERIAESSR